MICKLCNKIYLDEDTIIGLFAFSEICGDCKETFKPNELFEVIPITNGLIEYHYLYENMNLNIKQKTYLSRYLNKFYSILTEKFKKYDLYIFLDDDLYYDINILAKFLIDYERVYVFSLMRKELMYKEIF